MVFDVRESCEVCGSSATEDIVSLKMDQAPISTFLSNFYQGRVPLDLFKDAEFTLRKCKQCDFIWQKQVLKDEWMGVLYSQWIDDELSYQKSQGHKPEYYAKLREDAEFVYNFLNLSGKTPEVLDFGMGWGNWAHASVKRGMNVYGLELSERKILNGQSLGVTMLKSLEGREASFDYINSEQVFEHLSNPSELLDMLVKSLKPGGWIRISVPQYPKYNVTTASYIPTHDSMHPLEHINTFKKINLIQLGSKFGLKPLGLTQASLKLAAQPQRAMLFTKKYLGLMRNNSVLLQKL